MNRTLALLLSKWYDGALAPEHLADLRRSALTDDTIRQHFIRSIPPSMIGKLLGFDSPRIVSAMLLPFRSPADGFMAHVSMKVFPPLTDGDGHTVKYLQPKGTAPRLYFTIPSLQALSDDRPLWFVEGAKKALSVAQVGLPAVGFCGIEGWHVKGSHELISDFDAIVLTGRVIELVPDADVQTNPAVERGVARLARALKARGARVRLVVLPTEVEAA